VSFIQWNEVIINNNINNDTIFKKLDIQNEILYPNEKRDSFVKKSSSILFYSGNLNDYKNDNYIKNFKCESHFYKTDTLYINIRYSDFFSSHGFSIIYKNKTFHTKIDYITDMVSDQNENLPIYKTIYQRLILNKSNYQVGDSIFGKIDFKIDEIINDFKIEHFGKGSFRAKIVKL